MVKETVAMVYGLTNRNCPITTTLPSPPNLFYTVVLFQRKFLTNIPELIPPEAQKVSV